MKKTYYSVEDLKKIVRLEDRGSEIWNPASEKELVFEGTYDITLQDMQVALHTIFEKKVSLQDVLNWYKCVGYTFSYYTHALGPQDIMRMKCEEECPRHEFPSDERGALNRTWRLFFYYYEDLDQDLYEAMDEIDIHGLEKESETEYLPDVLREAMEFIDCFYQNQKLEKKQWICPKFMKHALLFRYGNVDEIQYMLPYLYEEMLEFEQASAEEKIKFVKWVDELAAEDDLLALYIRCYGRYTGNTGYEQDLYAACDDAKRLFDLTGSPWIANILGCIYYYGRVNGDEPEYEKAAPYLMYGALNDVSESIVKLADMYQNGHGVRKSRSTAEHMIEKLYDELLPQFKDGDHDDGSFADVALFKGSMILHRGDDPKWNAEEALEYLLEAEYAIQKRVKYHIYGDEIVASHIKRCLAEAKQVMPPEKNTGKHVAWGFWPLENLCEDGYKVSWKAKPLENGEWSVIFQRIKNEYEREPDKTFMVVPELYYCTFTDTVKGHVFPVGDDMPRQGKFSSLDDGYENGEDVTILYYKNKPVLKMKGCGFDWRIEKPEEASE